MIKETKLSYMHHFHEKDEILEAPNRKYTANFSVDFQLKTTSFTVPFGHTLRKVIEFLPDVLKTDYKELYNSGFKEHIQTYFQSEKDKRLFSDFIEYLLHIPPMHIAEEQVTLQNIYNFIEICIENPEYCTLTYLSSFACACVWEIDQGKTFFSPHSNPNLPLLFGTETDMAPGIAYSKDKMRSYLKAYSENPLALSPLTTYEFEFLSSFCLSSLHEIFSQGWIIKKCANCGRIFVPFTRSDTLCCNEASPQDPSKICKDYYKYQTYLQKSRNDLATKLYKQIYNNKRNKTLRCKNQVLIDDLDDFALQASKWREAIKKEQHTNSEYIDWLQTFKRKKAD